MKHLELISHSSLLHANVFLRLTCRLHPKSGSYGDKNRTVEWKQRLSLLLKRGFFCKENYGFNHCFLKCQSHSATDSCDWSQFFNLKSLKAPSVEVEFLILLLLLDILQHIDVFHFLNGSLYILGKQLCSHAMLIMIIL